LYGHIQDIVCGGYHTLALSDTKQVYAWGNGEFGQLGLGSLSHENEPRLIEALWKGGSMHAHAMAAGENHSLVSMGLFLPRQSNRFLLVCCYYLSISI
jgi:alpha-tubulin suppressor-like RCC1 family protein